MSGYKNCRIELLTDNSYFKQQIQDIKSTHKLSIQMTSTTFKYFMIILCICNYYSKLISADPLQQRVYIRPTGSSSNSCPRFQSDCHTLNEWIESDSNLFKNDTKIMLLPGIHMINSTQEYLFTKNVHSVVFTGVSGNLTTVWCLNGFMFSFIDIKNLKISNIVFKSCKALSGVKITETKVINSTLSFQDSRDVEIIGIDIEQGGIMIRQSELLCGIFNMHKLNITSNGIGIYSSITESDLEDDIEVENYNNGNCYRIFLRNSTLSMAMIKMVTYANVYIKRVVMKQTISPFGCIHIYAHNLSLTNITVTKLIVPLPRHC